MLTQHNIKKALKIVSCNSQKTSNTPELSVNYIQTALFYSFSESEMLQLFMEVDVTTTKLFFH